MKRLAIAGGVVLLAIVVFIFGADRYYHHGDGTACASCHEIRSNVELWRASTHRNVACTECHDSTMAGNVRRVVRHLSGNAAERVLLHTDDVLRMMARCRKCHQEEFASWRAGPHSATYRQIFAGTEHKTTDCMRCHGMHFDGPIQDVVVPVDIKGPWRLVRPDLANEPTMPCMTCHEIHREGLPASTLRRAPVEGPVATASLAFFDRRSHVHYRVTSLQIPQVHDANRPLVMSPDPRDGLCYQCHAPRSSLEAGSGDDRTPRGVHEGLSCTACHLGHNQGARASCATCHPRMSNCGLNVEKMDTTFASPASRHNIHSVACADCHADGRSGHFSRAVKRAAIQAEAGAR